MKEVFEETKVEILFFEETDVITGSNETDPLPFD